MDEKDELRQHIRNLLEDYQYRIENRVYDVVRDADAIARAEKLGQYRVSWEKWNENAAKGVGGACLCIGPIQLFPSDCYMTDDCLVHGKR